MTEGKKKKGGGTQKLFWYEITHRILFLQGVDGLNATFKCFIFFTSQMEVEKSVKPYFSHKMNFYCGPFSIEYAAD